MTRGAEAGAQQNDPEFYPQWNTYQTRIPRHAHRPPQHAHTHTHTPRRLASLTKTCQVEHPDHAAAKGQGECTNPPVPAGRRKARRSPQQLPSETQKVGADSTRAGKLPRQIPHAFGRGAAADGSVLLAHTSLTVMQGPRH